MNDNRPPPDHVVDDEPRGENESNDARLEDNIKSSSTWLRLLFMVLFLALACIAQVLGQITTGKCLDLVRQALVNCLFPLLGLDVRHVIRLSCRVPPSHCLVVYQFILASI